MIFGRVDYSIGKENSMIDWKATDNRPQKVSFWAPVTVGKRLVAATG